ncbi:hypothetical protein [Nocardioides sp.]|uniref:hypothetical protein n=1 Tax=Nocardioides sp. TaxID=35761 RepID=UPI003D1142C5
MPRHSRTILSAMLPVLVLAGLWLPLGAAQAAGPPPPGVAGAVGAPAVELRVGQEGSVGRFSSVSIPVLYRCQRPWLVAGLYVEVNRGAVTGFGARTAGLTCDGTWNRVLVGADSDTGEPFAAGYAEVRLTMDVQDPVTFDPVDQATASARIWIAPAARIVVDRAVLGPDGSVRVTVSARCQRPWVLSEYSVSVSQREGFVYGSAFRDTGLVCDALWHRTTLRVVGSEPFVRGRAIVGAGIYVLDPVDFDPVGADAVSRTVMLRR